MKHYRYVIYAGVVCLMAGCTITGRMNRRQYNTALEHSTKQQREVVEQQATERQTGYIEYTHEDGSKDYLIPTTTGADGETMMTLEIDEVVVVAKSRSLPERKGKVNIDFVVTLPKELQGNCQSIAVTPVLHKSTGDDNLEDLTIRGGLFSKVQERNYWQLDRYIERFNPDEQRERWAQNRFIYYPYPEDVRLDSVVEHKNSLKYYYTQEVPTSDIGGMLKVTLKGRVIALDQSYYKLPLSDTLEYSISSMLSFTDTTTRYMTKVIEKFAVVNDRNYLNFRVNRSDIIDTLGDNRAQLERIEGLMDEILNQKEFHVDSIILTASASPEGTVRKNGQLSNERAASLRNHLVKRFPKSRLDTLISVRSTGEDWPELARLIEKDERVKNRTEILKMIGGITDKNADDVEKEIKRKYPADYKVLLETLYPMLRAVSFKYDLRRVGMVKDTIHTTVPDTLYARGVRLLNNRRYYEALDILRGFNDRNAAVCLLSVGNDREAYEVLKRLPENSTHEYLKAVACARLGLKGEALEHFDRACEINPNMQYRGRLDPEISELIQQRDGKEE